VSIITNLDEQLAAAMNDHQITDDQGQIGGEETTLENSETQNETPVEEDTTAEKSVDTKETSPEESKESENEPEMVELASDDTGKRYVPESRFKEVYAKWKAAERGKSNDTPQVSEPIAPVQTTPVNKTDALEIELLRSTLPQFNPESPDYSREVDELGFSLYEGSKDPKGNYTITRLDAGRKALSMAKKITSKLADVKIEAKTVKAQQSDQGITNRVLNRESQKLDPEKMTLEEKEEWLKAEGLW
jgi:hypothetical protein